MNFDKPQELYGEKTLKPIYGAGAISNPKLLLIFMNPIAKNISSNNEWRGIRAPQVGTKNIWKLLFQLEIINIRLFNQTQIKKPGEWTPYFVNEIYSYIAGNKVFITNFAKCTQLDARLLKDSVFKSYRDLLLEEISFLNPKAIITFGNQVSENLLKKKVSVKNYSLLEFEIIEIFNNSYRVYPCYYPVGQGQRNMPLAVQRVLNVIKQVSEGK